jgi:hypothetical protein
LRRRAERVEQREVPVVLRVEQQALEVQELREVSAPPARLELAQLVQLVRAPAAPVRPTAVRVDCKRALFTPAARAIIRAR